MKMFIFKHFRGGGQMPEYKHVSAVNADAFRKYAHEIQSFHVHYFGINPYFLLPIKIYPFQETKWYMLWQSVAVDK